jgi:signal transduction histidine kinase
MKTQKVSPQAGGRKHAAMRQAIGQRARRVPGIQDREWLRAALHDGLGQILTSISFLASSLSQKLAGRRLPEASEAQELLSLADRAISETKALVHEKYPANGTAEADRSAARLAN